MNHTSLNFDFPILYNFQDRVTMVPVDRRIDFSGAPLPILLRYFACIPCPLRFWALILRDLLCE